MGCGASREVAPQQLDSEVYEDDEPAEKIIPKWRKLLSSDDARKKFELDGSLPANAASGLLELRGFLDDPILTKSIGEFGKNRKSFDSFMCWVDIHEFKCMIRGPDAVRRSKASYIYAKYIRKGSSMQIKGCSDEAYLDFIESTLENVSNGREEVSTNMFDRTQQHCLKNIYQDIFTPFKYSQAYNDIMADMQERYNKAKPDDFEFIEVLGQGGFGLVVHCKKKSTGKHYALKMQTKMGLLKTYKNVLYRVDFEKQALAACSHPYIVTLDYAFQTASLVFLAMQLGTAGTLHEAQEEISNKKMSEDRVRFYMAEIVLALAHIHGLGMIYRDLKPQNVLLNADGHVQLVDLGGIIDPGGHVLGIEDESDQMLNGLFMKDYANYGAKYLRSKSSLKSGRVASVKGNGGSNNSGRMGNVDAEVDPLRLHAEDAPSSSMKREDSASFSVGQAPKRARSIMGTDGYMAVEIMKLRLQKQEDRTGYTNAVDWWSLGVLAYVLLVGEKPYPSVTMETLPELLDRLESDEYLRKGTKWLLGNVHATDLPVEYRNVHNELNLKTVVSPDLLNALMLLLDFNESTRLGSAGAGGLRALKDHAVFKWNINAVRQGGGLFTVGRSSHSHSNVASVSNQNQSMNQSSSGADATLVSGGVEAPARTGSASLSASNLGTTNPVIGGAHSTSLRQHSHKGNNSSGNLEVYPICANNHAPTLVDDMTAASPTHSRVRQQRDRGYSSGPPSPNSIPPEACWDKLELKQVVPPFAPDAHSLNEKVAYTNFETMMNCIDKGTWLKQFPTSYYDEYFQNWDFVSPHILKMEYGLANVMEQYEHKYKARRLLGDMDDMGGAAPGPGAGGGPNKGGASKPLGGGLFRRLAGGLYKSK